MPDINASATVTSWALRGEFDSSFAILTGVETVRYLDGLGAAFAMVEPRSKAYINPRSDDGMDEFNYLDAPVSADAAIAHLKHAGGVGILGDHCDMVVIDLDAAAAEFITAHDALAPAARVFRDNAPDRVKLLVFCPDVATAEKSIKLESADGTRKIEVIGKRRGAIVAGMHESGAVIKLRTAYTLPLMSWAELITIAQAWTGTQSPDSSLSAQPLARSAQVANTRTIGDVNAEIIRWCVDHEDEVMADLGNPRIGAYVKLRKEVTPSARVTRHDDRIVLVDYGDENKHIDLFDVFIANKGIDKRTAIGRLMNGRDVETGARITTR